MQKRHTRVQQYKIQALHCFSTKCYAGQFESVTMNRRSAEQGSHGRKRKESLATEDRIQQTQYQNLQNKYQNTNQTI